MAKVTIYQITTGEALEVEPVDAREILAQGEYSKEPPVPGEPPPPVPEPEVPTRNINTIPGPKKAKKT